MRGRTVGPSHKLFYNFEKNWDAYKQKVIALNIDPIVRRQLARDRDRLLTLIEIQLQKNQVKAEYKKLLKLSMLFLGGSLAKFGLGLNASPQYSHARWLAKSTYSLRLYLFRHHLNLAEDEIEKLRFFFFWCKSVFRILLFVAGTTRGPCFL